MTTYMSTYYLPYEHDSQEHILESLMEKRSNLSLSSLREMMLEEPHKDWPIVVNNIESNGSIYELLRYALGKAILGVGPDSYEVHPEEDLFMFKLNEDEVPMHFFNCPEATYLTSLEETLVYLYKHKDSEMETEGSIKDLEFWWEENPLGVIEIQREYYL